MTATRTAYKWVGTRPVRHDGLDKVTGRARFGADFATAGMLHGAVLRSPHAHARIRSIDVSEALAVSGVKAIITGADLPELDDNQVEGGEGNATYRDLSRNILARDKVLYEGHAVAAVAATTLRVAEQAAQLIRVEYQVLAPVLTIEEAMADDAPLLHDDLFTSGLDSPPKEPSNIAARHVTSRGDPDAAWEEADLVVEREYFTKAVHQGYIEPHAVVAQIGEDGKGTVWGSSQGHFVIRTLTANVLGWDPGDMKFIPAEIGGGFGGKTTIYLEPLAALLSRRTGRPVKMVMTRHEVFRATGPTSGTWMKVKMGARKDGKLVAAQAWMAYEAGAFPGSPVGLGVMGIFACYDIPNVYLEGYDVVVNKPKVAAYRAPGAPMVGFAAESVIDELAEQLRIDPVEIRLRNAVAEGVRAVYGPKYRKIGLVETLETARDHPHYSAPLGPWQGRGVASGWWMNYGGETSATVNINSDGTAVVMSGCPDIGGSRASLAQMAAEELGIDVHRIEPVVADTHSIGYNDLTGGSRVTFAVGMAVVSAARELIEDMCSRAARMWDVPPEEVEWVEGRAQSVSGAFPPLTLEELAAGSARTGGPLSATNTVNPRGVGVAFSTQICDVEVDPETGRVTILRYTVAQDAGRAIHPDYVEGQMQGGVVQGIGWALNEEYIFDGDGVMENPGFLDYRMPVASDLPMIDTVIVEVPNPEHPYGVRGVGEVGIVPPLGAVANAVYAATGKRIQELPMSPVKVLEALSSG
ncbi:MAG: xanthine dehydrogenase family protein molybdopterin-binding subunit [bacterium]|nr:xanthine dehydrogenase family protein molybdopterin-binding subunit [Acidimicrobiia bacterium]MCY4651252.1 xanthine dehydrogenase family protein molybdopterin-binding subunit [bacterium]